VKVTETGDTELFKRVVPNFSGNIKSALKSSKRIRVALAPNDGSIPTK
jgi:hypothetical protein